MNEEPEVKKEPEKAPEKDMVKEPPAPLEGRAAPPRPPEAGTERGVRQPLRQEEEYATSRLWMGMPPIKAAALGILAAVLLVMGYLLFFTDFRFFKQKAPEVAERVEYENVKVYYPYRGRLNMEDRKVRKDVVMESMAAAVITEFLSGPAGRADSYVPEGARLLGVYPGSDGVLYVDLSDEFRSNFSGDALSEFLLLRGLYESILANIKDAGDVKVLIEGAETESVGGHVLITRPLARMVSQMIVEDSGGR